MIDFFERAASALDHQNRKCSSVEPPQYDIEAFLDGANQVFSAGG